MTNEQATELLALMDDQLKATDRLTETFEKRFTQFTQLVLNGFVCLEDKFDKKTDMLAEEIRGTNQRVENLTGRVDDLTAEVREIKEDIRGIKAEAQTTNRRLAATFNQAGRLTEAATGQQVRLHQLETEEPTNAELPRRVPALEEQMRRAS